MASHKALSPKSLFGKFSKSNKPSSKIKSTFVEKFEIIGKNMVIYNESLKIKMKTNQWHTAYGLLSISSLSAENIYKWTLKITRRITTPKICIGICSKRDDGNNAFHQKYDRFFYGFCTKDGSKLSSFNRNNEYYSPPAKHHDIILMELNIYTKTLKYYKNYKDLGIAFTNIDIRQTYCLAVAIFGNDSKVELIAFEKYKQECHIEEKDGNIEKEYIIKENKILNMSLKTRNDKLQKDNNELCDNIDEENTMLLKLKQDKRKQQLEINNLKMIISNLREDNKEMENEHLELQNKINIIKLQKLDEINYEKWNTKQLIYWIININYNKYKKYEKDLTNILIEEQIDGSCLKDIEFEDIETWNINVLEHRNHILNKIKLLTHKSIEYDHIYMDMNTQKEAYIPPLPPPPPPVHDNIIKESMPYESKQSEIIAYNTQFIEGNDSLDDIDNIDNIAYVDNDKVQSMDVPVQYEKYDSLDVMQQKYLIEEINKQTDELMIENNMITPQ